jgi:hypothetical protein
MILHKGLHCTFVAINDIVFTMDTNKNATSHRTVASLHLGDYIVGYGTLASVNGTWHTFDSGCIINFPRSTRLVVTR